MESYQNLIKQIQDLLSQWDELAADARQQGVDQDELYFHGVELGFELARDQLSTTLADIIRRQSTAGEFYSYKQ